MTREMVTALQKKLDSRIILPEDPEYNAARKVHNGMIDKRPAVIVYCNDVEDVKVCVNFARQNKLLLAVRCGGHNAAGFGICDDAVVIDLSLLKTIQVNARTKTVRVGGGCLLKEIDTATHEIGMAVPLGFFGGTGVGGLALGGGLGYLTRQFNGAASEINTDETAWNFREANYSIVILGIAPDAGGKESVIKWVRNYWSALQPYSLGGAYINFMMDEGVENVKSNYGNNYKRLAEIKAKYDPENLFRINQNIKPAN